MSPPIVPAQAKAQLQMEQALEEARAARLQLSFVQKQEGGRADRAEQRRQ